MSRYLWLWGWVVCGVLALGGIVLISSARADSIFEYNYYCANQYWDYVFDQDCYIPGEECIPDPDNPCPDTYMPTWHAGNCLGPAPTGCIANVTYPKKTYTPYECNCSMGTECGCMCSPKEDDTASVVGCATSYGEGF